MNRLRFAIFGAAILALSSSLAAQPSDGYTAGKLLSPCQEADNDARWGEAAETECEQYLLGFVDALKSMGGSGVCAPPVNTADEVRWAFMRWVHADYTARRAMPASDALMTMLKETYACK